MAKSLKQKAAKGMVWTSIQKASHVGISFVSGIILARLLTPYDYGCIGMLAIFMLLADEFINAGFGSALIQKKLPTQDDYSTVFWWNMGMAAFMYAVLYFCAPAIARFYEIPLLCNVLRVQGLILFIHAFNLVQRNQLRKNLDFKALSIVTIVSSLISLGVTIVLAYQGYGVWALVAQNMIVAAIPALVFWFYLKWRPQWTFSWASFKELFSFGFYIFMSSIINTFFSKITRLLIGKLYSPVTLGYYSKAASTENLASNTLSSMLTQVTYPLYSQIQDDKAALQNMIRRLTMTVAYITFPLLFVLMLTAKPIFVLLYSERWLPSVPYFQVLCLVGLANCLQAINTQSIAAIGKSRIMFRWTLIKRTFGTTFIIGGLIIWGMKGLLCGVVLYNWFCYFVNIALVSRHIGYKWHRQLLDLMPMAVAAVVSAATGYGCASLLHLSLYPDGLVKFAVCMTLYLAWSLVFRPEAYIYTLTIIPARFRFWKKRKMES